MRVSAMTRVVVSAMSSVRLRPRRVHRLVIKKLHGALRRSPLRSCDADGELAGERAPLARELGDEQEVAVGRIRLDEHGERRDECCTVDGFAGSAADGGRGRRREWVGRQLPDVRRWDLDYERVVLDLPFDEVRICSA